MLMSQDEFMKENILENKTQQSQPSLRKAWKTHSIDNGHNLTLHVVKWLAG